MPWFDPYISPQQHAHWQPHQGTTSGGSQKPRAARIRTRIRTRTCARSYTRTHQPSSNCRTQSSCSCHHQHTPVQLLQPTASSPSCTTTAPWAHIQFQTVVVSHDDTLAHPCVSIHQMHPPPPPHRHSLATWLTPPPSRSSYCTGTAHRTAVQQYKSCCTAHALLGVPRQLLVEPVGQVLLDGVRHVPVPAARQPAVRRARRVHLGARKQRLARHAP
mmetsp:Transcript_9690/g.24077  ORF Transcript_9690/g.24077 Transcript_9690/m.24077 type:complete len:217 (+) Transcript_9690:125-775(+)